MIFAVLLIFVGGLMAGGVAVALLFRNSRRVRAFISQRTTAVSYTHLTLPTT